MSDAREARLKIDRARHHFDNLKAEAERIRSETDRHRIFAEYDSDEGCHIILSKLDRAALPDLGLILGDCIQNARNALDYLAWQLALAHLKREPTEKEAKAIQFPISKDAASFATSGVLKLVSRDAGVEMGKHQPPPGDASAPLTLLHWLSNRDKHRLLVQTLSQTTTSEWTVHLPSRATSARQEPYVGAVAGVPGWLTYVDNREIKGEFGVFPLARLYIEPAKLAPTAQVDIDYDSPVEVVFGGPSGNVSVTEIKAITDEVERVINCFDGFF